jgi:adenylate cyclase
MSETRKLAAILVADAVGYSRLAGADEDRTLARLRGLRSDLIDPAISAHHGRIVKRTGDGSIIEFRSVVDAVRCAIEVQNGLIERNAGVPEDRRIRFRVGIHVGDVVEESDGDLMGDGVNIAARLEGNAKPGAICLSEDAYRQVSGRLEMEVTDLGPTQLKNIDRQIRAYSLQVGVPAKPKPAEPVTPAAPTPQKRRFGLAPLAAALAALLVVIAGGAWWFLNSNRPATVASNAPPPLAAQRLSVVVLPFANLNGDPAQDYLADALTDELTTALARIRESFVIARNTAMTFKGKPVDAKAIGKDLGVRYVLEGSVQPSGNRVRVNAQLIDADSGAHLWADQFDTPRADLLQTQDAIVARLGRAMNVELTGAETARLKRAQTANPDAEDLALQCTAAVQKANFIGKDADAGYRLCEQALAVDPNNARALTWLSAKYYAPIPFGRSADPKADLKRADELASQALALDPNYALAHIDKARILDLQEREEESIAEAERALALSHRFPAVPRRSRHIRRSPLKFSGRTAIRGCSNVWTFITRVYARQGCRRSEAGRPFAQRATEAIAGGALSAQSSRAVALGFLPEGQKVRKFLCASRNLCYMLPNHRIEPAARGAARPERRRKFLFGNRCNPLKSPDSDE